MEMGEFTFWEGLHSLACDLVWDEVELFECREVVEKVDSFVIDLVVIWVIHHLPKSSVSSFSHFPWESKRIPFEVIWFLSEYHHYLPNQREVSLADHFSSAKYLIPESPNP